MAQKLLIIWRNLDMLSMSRMITFYIVSKYNVESEIVSENKPENYNQ